MQRILPVLTVMALALTGACSKYACSKKDKDEGKRKPKTAAPGNTTDSTANIPAFAHPNSRELFAQVRKGCKKPLENFSGTFQMKSSTSPRKARSSSTRSNTPEPCGKTTPPSAST